MTAPWLDKLDTAHNTISAQAALLHALAHSLFVVGNTLLAERVASIADKLNRAAKDVSDASSAVVTDMLQSAEQSSQNMLHAALAGAALGEKVTRDAQHAGETDRLKGR